MYYYSDDDDDDVYVNPNLWKHNIRASLLAVSTGITMNLRDKMSLLCLKFV